MKKQIKDALSEEAKGDAYGRTGIDSRIEEVKKILKDCTDLHKEIFGGMTVQFADLDINKATHQICQLFPQPLDDKELGEGIAESLRNNILKQGWKLSGFEGDIWDKSYIFTDQILALLQPKIEEANNKGFERGKQYSIHENKKYTEIVKKAKREERDYVVAWLDDIFLCEAYTVEQKEGLCYKMWQALKGGE